MTFISMQITNLVMLLARFVVSRTMLLSIVGIYLTILIKVMKFHKHWLLSPSMMEMIPLFMYTLELPHTQIIMQVIFLLSSHIKEMI